MNVTTRHLVPSSPFYLWRVFSVQMCATPAIFPLFHHPFFPMRVMQPHHTHTVILSDVSYSIALSCLSFSYRSRITIMSPVLPRHSCMHHIVTVVSGTIVPVYLLCSPVLHRHSGIHHTLHYARDYHSRTIVMQHRSTRHSWTHRTFHLAARNNTVPHRHFCMQHHRPHPSTYTQHHLTTHLLYEPHHRPVCSQFMFHRILSFTVSRA